MLKESEGILSSARPLVRVAQPRRRPGDPGDADAASGLSSAPAGGQDAWPGATFSRSLERLDRRAGYPSASNSASDVLDLFSSAGYRVDLMAFPTAGARGRGRRLQRRRPFRSPRSSETFDDGWTTDDERPPPLRTTVTAEKARDDHHPQRQPRRQLRPIDQSLPRLRARLHLLLCPAGARLHGPLARARFREPPVLQARRRSRC